MSQPEAAPPTDGASALLAAAERKSSGRRPRYTPKAKESQSPVGTAASSEEPVPVAQEAPAPPEAAPAVKDADAATSTPQQPTEPPKPAEGPPAPDTAPVTPPSSSAETPAPRPDPTEEETPPPPPAGEVGFPAKPLSFESVFTRRRQPDMDPEMFAMVQQRQAKLLKSMANIVLMFQERRDEYDRSVASAVAAGFPKEELAKLAIAHDCLPFLEAALGEHVPGTSQ